MISSLFVHACNAASVYAAPVTREGDKKMWEVILKLFWYMSVDDYQAIVKISIYVPICSYFLGKKSVQIFL